ncbi:MAG: chemotaxis protein CheA [candidate division NC10 bacterium]|nr:chemotaxis protein CheA [candidate division NC10 bacterium]
MDLSKYLKMFISESQEHLQKMDGLLLELENDPGARVIIDTLFREAHSLKGMSATMGFEDLAKISHRMEDFLERFRGGREPLRREAVDFLFEGVDLLRKGIEEVAASGKTIVDSSAFVSKMSAYTSSFDAVPLKIPPPTGEGAASFWKEEEFQRARVWAKEQGLFLFTLEVSLAQDAPLPAARAYIILKRLQEMGELLQARPSQQEVQAGQFSGRLVLLLGTSASPAEVQRKVAAMPDVAAVHLILHGGDDEPPMREPKLFPTPELQSAPPPSLKPSLMVRVDAKLLDDLMDQVGELIVAKGSLLEISQGLDSRPLKECVDRFEGLIKALQRQAMKLRMMPIEFIADRFPRAVRDLAKRHGKVINFEIKGREIELDRAMLEQLADPLLHLLRNAVDHGIEPPDERQKVGKPSMGTLRLEASQEREGVAIRIIDDGRGIDVAKIRRVALERGMINKEEHDGLPDEEALLLITKPGFSTATEVSETSGRGVGMDVVRATVEALRGNLQIESQIGEGTTVTLRLPPSLAVIPVLITRVGSEQYAIPLYQILSTLEFSEGEVQRVQGQEILRRDGRLIPLLRLRSTLGCPVGLDPASGLALVTVVRGREIGVVVDELLRYQDAVRKPLGKALKGLKGLAGVTILGNGEMVLMLDLNTLI